MAACIVGNCLSGCYWNEDDDSVRTEKSDLINGTLSSGNVPDSVNHLNLCLKCKLKKNLASFGTISIDRYISRFFFDFFCGNLFGKFKLVVTFNAMISPMDNVLVIFSGGPSSRVVLQFLHEMQQKAQKNFDASRDRSLSVFGVGVAFVNESAASRIPFDEFDKAIQDMKSIVSNLVPLAKAFHVVPIERIYSSNGRDRLKELLNGVKDLTGKEDLLQHLRML